MGRAVDALGAAGATGVAALGANPITGALGYAAVAHSSNVAILSSIGVGGTGYIAGTLGGGAATTLAVLSAPAAIVTAGSVVAGGLGTYIYCRSRR